MKKTAHVSQMMADVATKGQMETWDVFTES